MNKLLCKIIDKIFIFMERNNLNDKETELIMKDYQKIKNLI